jgi:hypothetical protein
MSKDIDIVIAIDTVSLLANVTPGSYQNPAGLSHGSTDRIYTFMIAQALYVNSGQATGNLNISALVNDTIRWRTASLSGNTDEAAIVYLIQQYSGDQVTSQPVTAYVSNPYEPVPIIVNNENTEPPTFTSPPVPDYFMQATVNNHGTEQYKVYFYVTKQDQKTGKPVIAGYYWWDPTIVVP